MNKIAGAFCVVVMVMTFAPVSARSEDSTLDENAIKDTARSFVEAYDNADARTIASLWAEDADYHVGQMSVKGRPAIQQLYDEFLRAHPGSKMEIHIDSIRMLTPAVAIEQGTASVSNSPNGPPTSSAYTAVHVKHDGKWQMASVRESNATFAPTEESLNDLAWLVGEWKAEGDAAKVDVKYEWMENQHFLRGTTTVYPSKDSPKVSGGMQIITKDSLTGQIVSWFFNADGGYGYGTWTKDGARWLIRAHGATPDGAAASATNILYHADDNVLSWQSIDRTVGNQPLPNTTEIVVERVVKDMPTKP